MSFETAVALTIGFEGNGRISRDPNDPGGVTRWGIAQRWHPGIDVEKLTRAGAVEILFADYWAPLRGHELPWPLAAVAFDHAVHSGAPDAAEALQRTIGAKPDGRVGPLSLRAAWGAWGRSAELTLEALLRRRIVELIEEARPDYLAGWMGRCSTLGIWAGRELERARAA